MGYERINIENIDKINQSLKGSSLEKLVKDSMAKLMSDKLIPITPMSLSLEQKIKIYRERDSYLQIQRNPTKRIANLKLLIECLMEKIHVDHC